MNQPLLFVAADRREIELFVRRWSSVTQLELPVHWARRGIWRGRDVIAIANGMGVRRAQEGVRAVLGSNEGFAGICSAGTCGALVPGLEIAEVVVGTSVIDDSLKWAANDPAGSATRKGVVLTSRHIARTAEEKRKLSAMGAIIVEMEAAGIAGVAAELVVPFYCIRSVSDLANESFFFDYESFVRKDGRMDIGKIMLAAIRHPVRGLPELMRLQRRSAKAAEGLAAYLDGCRF